MEDQTARIVSEVDERDLGLGPLETNSADEQPHVRLLLREDMLDRRAYLGLGPVGCAEYL